MKISSKLVKSSNNSRISFDALLKSMSMYDSYSFFAKCSTTVDFPTRRAPSTKMAVPPCRRFFHSSNLLYNLRLKIIFPIFFFLLRMQRYDYFFFPRDFFIIKDTLTPKFFLSKNTLTPKFEEWSSGFKRITRVISHYI